MFDENESDEKIKEKMNSTGISLNQMLKSNYVKYKPEGEDEIRKIRTDAFVSL